MSPKQTELEATMAAQIDQSDLPPPSPEYPFAKDLGRKWRFDFAWPEYKVALEVEGGTWVGGAHTRGRGYESDVEKYNVAGIAGWLVIRATNHMVNDERALNTVRTALMMRGA